MPPTHVPKFPVVDPDPSMRRALGNFGLKDVGYIFAFTTSGYVVGWFGARKPFRAVNGRITAGLGLIGGCLYAAMRSTQRLAGLEPNAAEVRTYGALSPEESKKRDEQLKIPNLNLIDSSANHD